jgi:innexin
MLTLFLISKLCYIGNAIGQLFLLNVVLAFKYHTFGADILRSLIDNVDWTEESYVAFPRVTLCDFSVRGQDMRNAHTYTIQCVLPINLYNEKIYLYLWLWFVFVAGVSVIRFVEHVRNPKFLDRIQ